jgi:hypothetical protein
LGQLGDGTTTSRYTPKPFVDTNNVLSGKMVVRVASKGNFAIMLTDANTIVGTGLNSKYYILILKI